MRMMNVEMTTVRKRTAGVIVGAVVAALGFTGGVANAASYTTVDDAAFGEDGHRLIFEQWYGGGEVGSFDLDVNNRDFIGSGAAAGISAIRLADQNTAGPDDQIWNNAMLGDGPISARAVARFAQFPQSFGYVPGVTEDVETEFANLFDVTGSEFNVQGSATNIDLGHLESFRWAREGVAGVRHTSLEADNDDLDHMVTYKIEGLDRLQPVYMLFFEDSFKDWDYQDLVIEIAAVPSPAAIGPGLALLGVLGLTRRRRNRE
jgi:hypothetical protein